MVFPLLFNYNEKFITCQPRFDNLEGYMNFSQNLKELRIKKNLTQEQLASLICSYGIRITKFTIRDYEQNKTRPKFETLELLKRILDCTYDDLLK